VRESDDDTGSDDTRRERGALHLHVGRLLLPAAPRPLLLRRDRPFDATAPAQDVADVLRYVVAARRALRGPLCVEIEGPGDPLASADTVLRALALLHEHHPDVLTGLVIDGPLLDEYVEELGEFGLAYVRVRLDTLRLRTARRLVGGAIHRGEALDRLEAAQLLVEQPLRALHVARRAGIAAAARIALLPALNGGELATLARAAAEAGAERVEVVAGSVHRASPLARLGSATGGELAQARATAARAVADVRAVANAAHVAGPLAWLDEERIRPVPLDLLDADDVRRLLPEPDDAEREARILPPRRAQIVAVATEDGSLVDLPLAQAPALRLFAVTDGAIHPVGARALARDPRRRIDGVGNARDFLEAVMGCRAVVATRIAARAATLLEAVGIRAVAAGGPVAEGLDRVARGTLRAAR
jgi:predicted Fe-Mo cluster-binding NifX family protein